MDNATIERAKSAVSIVDLAASLGIEARREGKTFKCRCPFHQDSTPSMSLDPVSNLWKCFGCEKAGNTIQFLMEYEKLDFNAAAEKLLAMGGSGGARPNMDDKKLERKVDQNFQRFGKAYEMPLEKWMPYHRAALASELAHQEFLKRGITRQTLLHYKIGYIEDGTKITSPDAEQYAESRKKPWIGFAYVYGDRVRLVKWRPVFMSEKASKQFVRISKMADVLYIDGEPDAMEDVLLVEGEIDAMTLSQCGGYRVASLPSGYQSKIDGEMKDWLLGFRKIYLCLDNDDAGKVCLRRLLAVLPADRTGIVTIPPDAKDANGLFKACAFKEEMFKAAMDELLERAEKPSAMFFRSLDEAFDEYRRQLATKDGEERFFSFPWRHANDMIIASPGDVMTFASSRTGSGKTSFWTQTGIYNAKYLKRRVGYYTGEMDMVNELVPMITAQTVRQDRNDLSVADVEEAQRELAGCEFYFGYDSAAKDWADVAALLEMAVKRLALDVVVIDHLDYIIRDPDFRKELSLKAQAMRWLAEDFAKKYGVFTVVIRQMNKATGSDQKRKKSADPDMYDIPGSIAGVTDSHHVFILHRKPVQGMEEGKHQDSLENETKLILDKSRHKGKGGRITNLIFRGKYARFDRPQEDIFDRPVPAGPQVIPIARNLPYKDSE